MITERVKSKKNIRIKTGIARYVLTKGQVLDISFTSKEQCDAFVAAQVLVRARLNEVSRLEKKVMEEINVLLPKDTVLDDVIESNKVAKPITQEDPKNENKAPSPTEVVDRTNEEVIEKIPTLHAGPAISFPSVVTSGNGALNVDLDDVTPDVSKHVVNNTEENLTNSRISEKTMSNEEVEALLDSDTEPKNKLTKLANKSKENNTVVHDTVKVIDHSKCPKCGKRKSKNKPLCNRCMKVADDS